MAFFPKFLALFSILAVLVHHANAGAFTRRSANPVQPAVERVVQVSILPSVPAFVNPGKNGRETSDTVSRRGAVKSQRVAGYSLEASLFALDEQKTN